MTGWRRPGLKASCLPLVLVVLVMAGLGILGLADSAPGMGYATGALGARGTLLVRECHSTEPTRGGFPVQCTGAFTPSGSGRTDTEPDARINSQETVGRGVTVQEDAATGDCYSVGAAPFLAWLALLLSSLAGLEAALLGAAATAVLISTHRRIQAVPRTVERVRRRLGGTALGRHPRRWSAGLLLALPCLSLLSLAAAGLART